jgi:hypothetical protein
MKVKMLRRVESAKFGQVLDKGVVYDADKENERFLVHLPNSPVRMMVEKKDVEVLKTVKEAKPKVVTVSIKVTCMEDEAETVKNSLNDWFCNNETSLVQDKGESIDVSEPRPMKKWMKETFGME